MADDDDDREPKRLSREWVIPGIPTHNLPQRTVPNDPVPTRPVGKPKLLPPPELESTPVDGKRRQRQCTLTDGFERAPPAPPAQSLPPPAPRGPPPKPSITPGPESDQAVRVDDRGVRVRLSWSNVKPYVPWIGLLFFGSGGWITTRWAAWRSVEAEVAAMHANDDDHAKRLKALETKVGRHDERLDEQQAAQASEAQSNRTERATRDGWHRDDVDATETLKKAFRIEGLPKPAPK